MRRKKHRLSARPAAGQEPEAQGEDYVFRFSLTGPDADDRKYDDPLLELVRGQFADLLDVAVLTYHGKRVIVDGFRLLQDPDTQYEIHPHRPSGSDPGTDRR